MGNTDNHAVEKALLFDVYYSDDRRPWEALAGEKELREMLLHWFCPRVLGDRQLLPEIPADRADALCRTYGMGAALAAHTNPARSTEITAQAVAAIVPLFDTTTVGGRDFAVRRTDAVRAYLQTLLDSAEGVEDKVSAMELAYMFLCDIPRDAAHARRLTETCYQWMYWYSKLSIDRVAAEKADIEARPASMY